MPMHTPSSRWDFCRAPVALAMLAAAACTSPKEPNWNPISEEETKQLFVFSPVNSIGYFGHGFVLERDGHQPLGITSLWVAGPESGVATEPTVATAWLRTVVDSTVLVRLGQRLPIPTAQTFRTNDSQHDVAAYTVIDYLPERALSLAAALPAVGDTVFVLAMQNGDSPLDGPRRHPAQVVVSSDLELHYVYLASSNTYNTSGAAVLDKNGKVVGMNVGSFVSGPRVHGLAVGVNSLRALLPD